MYTIFPCIYTSAMLIILGKQELAVVDVCMLCIHNHELKTVQKHNMECS